MTISSNACQSFKITATALKLLGIICRFMYFSEKYFIFGWACQILGIDGWKIWAKKGKYLIFQGFRRVYVQVVPKWLGGPWLHFFDQKLLSVIRIWEENLKIMHFKPIFQPIPQIWRSLPPHFKDDWIFLTFHLFLVYRTWISKNLARFRLF